MATRNEEKQRLRELRLSKQEEATRTERRRLGAYAAAAVAVVALVAGALIVALGGGDGGSSAATRASDPFGPHHSGLQDRMAAAKVPTMMDTMGSSSHFHPHLAVYVDGKQIEVPVNIGIDPSRPPMEMAGLHTHDAKGTIHDEGMPSSTLGQFFAVWGVPLSPTRLGPFEAEGAKVVRMWVDGRPSRAFGRLALEEGQQIVIAYGTAEQVPEGVSEQQAGSG